MSQRFQFDAAMLHSVAGGKSAIDMSTLNIHTLEEADSFIRGYGFDLSKNSESEKIWYYHRRALVLMVEKLHIKEEDIPEGLRDRKLLRDIRKLLIYASSRREEDQDLHKWSCVILKCMHVFVHSENDLFSSFSEEIQSQILTPFQKIIWHDGNTHKTFLKSERDEVEPIPLLAFDVKPFKTSTSTVIKLLAKPDAIAMKVFDKLGVRFVTGSLFDSFQVIRFLVQENIISFPHIMPDQSSNNIYPVELFVQVCEELERNQDSLDDHKIEAAFERKMSENKEEVRFLRKENNFSGDDYRFIKFIARKVIHIQPPGAVESFSFFYPFEVQIMDSNAYEKVLSGPSEHVAYKERQRQAARQRLRVD